MLIAGGYFRARIPTLSPFDKVVGGMVWSITASNVDLDVEILFEENSTIGQRIRLSENIVKALLKMQCPSPLQSHQIQGLDYDHILPVIKWLVRKAIETRQLTGDEVRSLSVSQFAKVAKLPEDGLNEAALQYVSAAANNYKAQRRFKKRDDAQFESEVGRVEATLLEYGEKIYGPSRLDVEQEEKKKSRAGAGRKLPGVGGGDSAEEEASRRRAEEEEQARRVSALQGQLFASSGEAKVSGSAIGEIVGMRADDIREATAAYQEELKRAGGGVGGGNGEDFGLVLSAKDAKKVEEVKHSRLVEAFKRRLAEAERLVESRRAPLEDVEARVQAIEEALRAKEELIRQIAEETKKVEEIENDAEKQEIIARLRSLVVMNESLKKQEQQFKAMCRDERQRLLDMIQTYDSANGDEELEKMLEIERIYEGDMVKLHKLRQMLAKKNQEIAKTNRLIDEIPTRAELLQFERRFVELYELMSEKFIETRKYYDLYNTLTTSYEYLQNELVILESIIKNFPVGMQSKAGQDAMLQQFGLMWNGVEASSKSVHEKLNNEQKNHEVLMTKHAKLVEKQRAYFKLVKEFQEECTLNEKLSAAMDALGAARS